MNHTLAVAGRGMHACTMGSGDAPAILLLSGSGVPLPQLEYLPLLRELSRERRVVLLEKFGYGASDLTDTPRTIESITAEYRTALAALDITAPVVLAAHSMGFLEALHWAQHFPEEVTALIGIDPATPDCYQDFDTGRPLRQMAFLARHPLLRQALSACVLPAQLRSCHPSRAQRKLLRNLTARNLGNAVWRSEAVHLPDTLAALAAGPMPRRIPTLFLLSNGTGTGMPADVWQGHANAFLTRLDHTESRLYDLPHDLYRQIPGELAQQIFQFLSPTPHDQKK